MKRTVSSMTDTIIRKLDDQELTDEFLQLKGMVLELQRRVSQDQGDDRNLSFEINTVNNLIWKTKNVVNGLTLRFTYLRDILNALRISDE